GKCFECGKKGHWIANCRDKRCSGCKGLGNAADVCPTPEEEAVDSLGRIGEGEPASQVGDEVCICDSGASTHMTLSADFMINYRD
ncbi:unnamed protein product, partial [Scytosiphon promiscuus]